MYIQPIKLIKPYIVGVYSENFKFIGNGIICQVYKKPFLLSCDHVLADVTKKKEKFNVGFQFEASDQLTFQMARYQMVLTANDKMIFVKPDVMIVPILAENIKSGTFLDLSNQDEITKFNVEVKQYLDSAPKISEKENQHVFSIGEELFTYCLLTSQDFSAVRDFFQSFQLNSFSSKFDEGFVISVLPEGCSGSAIFYLYNKKGVEIVGIFMGYFEGKNVSNWDPAYIMMRDEGFKKFIKKFSKNNISDSKMSEISAFLTTQPIVKEIFCYLQQ